ncbi:MAG: TrmH family RNA methyltransferase [Acidobacteriota bacterium]
MISKNHPRIKTFRRVIQHCSKKSEDLFPVEGVHMVREALDQGVPIQDALVSPALLSTKEGQALIERISLQGIQPAEVPAQLFESISDLQAPQGILILCRKRQWTKGDLRLNSKQPLLVLCGVQDPGNLGTIVRSCDASGAPGIVTLEGTVSMYNLKVIRATMGSLFRFPVLEAYSPEQLLKLAARIQYRLIAAVGSGGTDFQTVDYQKSALLLGSEAGGIPQELLERAAATISIPIAPGVDSLNVGIAAAVLLFRQPPG